MKNTTTVTIEHTEAVVEIKTCWSDAEANEFLAQGWILLHGGVAHKDGMGYQAKPVFVLCRKR